MGGEKIEIQKYLHIPIIFQAVFRDRRDFPLFYYIFSFRFKYSTFKYPLST